jgi:membrane fusion protein (multidrug efflux system)
MLPTHRQVKMEILVEAKRLAPNFLPIEPFAGSEFTEIQPERPHKGKVSSLQLPLLLFAVSLPLLGGCGGKQAAPPPAPLDVEVVDVVQKDVPIYGEWVATLDGYVNAQIHPQVSGYLIKQNYKEGSPVRKGEVLFEIDPRPFQAALDQAKAQLAQAEAQLGKATLDVERDTPLAEARAIAHSQLDNDTQAKLGAKALVGSAKAQVEQAQLNLEFTNVRSLVDGIAGIAAGQVGDLVGPNSILTTVSQVDPIKAYFTVSEQEYLDYVRRNPTEAARQAQEKHLDLELILADGTTYPRRGKFFAADRQVNVQTGAIRLAGLFPNPGNILRPGQYGRVRAATNVQAGALLVPQRAVTELQGSYQVAVVGTDNKVSIRAVKVGERVSTMWIIDKGLKPGERIVVEGVQKVREGTLVTPKPINPPMEGY